ncbi:hypothetical protein [Dysosmobacter sp.]
MKKILKSLLSIGLIIAIVIPLIVSSTPVYAAGFVTSEELDMIDYLFPKRGDMRGTFPVEVTVVGPNYTQDFHGKCYSVGERDDKDKINYLRQCADEAGYSDLETVYEGVKELNRLKQELADKDAEMLRAAMDNFQDITGLSLQNLVSFLSGVGFSDMETYKTLVSQINSGEAFMPENIVNTVIAGEQFVRALHPYLKKLIVDEAMEGSFKEFLKSALPSSSPLGPAELAEASAKALVAAIKTYKDGKERMGLIVQISQFNEALAAFFKKLNGNIVYAEGKGTQYVIDVDDKVKGTVKEWKPFIDLPFEGQLKVDLRKSDNNPMPNGKYSGTVTYTWKAITEGFDENYAMAHLRYLEDTEVEFGGYKAQRAKGTFHVKEDVYSPTKMSLTLSSDSVEVKVTTDDVSKSMIQTEVDPMSLNLTEFTNLMYHDYTLRWDSSEIAAWLEWSFEEIYSKDGVHKESNINRSYDYIWGFQEYDNGTDVVSSNIDLRPYMNIVIKIDKSKNEIAGKNY